MCHYRHHAHADPFFLPGLQDITSHVDSALCGARARADWKSPAHQSGAVPRQLRHHRGDVAHAAEDGAKFLPLANQANRLRAGGNGGALQVTRSRSFSQTLLGSARRQRARCKV